MKQLSPSELYDEFVDTISMAQSSTLLKSDDDIEYYLLEEIDCGMAAILHDGSLTILQDNGLISENEVLLASAMRKKWMALGEFPRNAEFIKQSAKWKEILSLGDQLMMYINQRKEKT